MLPRPHRQFCLSEAGQAAGFNAKLITVEVVSRGLIDTTQFSIFCEVTHTTHIHIYTHKCSLTDSLIHTNSLSLSPSLSDHPDIGGVEAAVEAMKQIYSNSHQWGNYQNRSEQCVRK